MVMIFAGLSYYPAGGWKDYKGSVPSVLDALNTIAKMDGIDWWQIVVNGEIIQEGTRS